MLARLEIAIESGRIVVPIGGNAAVADVPGPAMSLQTWAELLSILFREQFPVYAPDDADAGAKAPLESGARVEMYAGRVERGGALFRG